MNKKELAKKNKLVNGLIEKWRDWLLLNEWHISSQYGLDDKGDSPFQTFAEIDVNEVYKKARITFFPCFFKDSLEEQEKIIIHELCHCITEPAFDIMINQHNGVAYHKHQHSDCIETITQRMTNAIHLVSKHYGKNNG